MEGALAAGVAIYNAGRYHAAHDAWEDHWLELESGTDDERFLHGLIQFTAAVHHGREANWSGATGLAESGGDYLAGLPSDYRGVNLDEVRAYLGTLAADPEVIERCDPLPLRIDGTVVRPVDLGIEGTLAAARVYAEVDGYDEALIERACVFAREDAAEGGGSPVVSLLFDFVREPGHRGLVTDRLGAHVDRRRARADDVDGLFE